MESLVLVCDEIGVGKGIRVKKDARRLEPAIIVSSADRLYIPNHPKSTTSLL
jgi:hypothetical protein